MGRDRLRVAINAQLYPPSEIGGVATVLRGLVRALGALDGPERYVLIGPWQDPEWLRPHTGSNQRIVRGPLPPLHQLKRALGPLRPVLSRLRGRVGQTLPSVRPAAVAASDGFYEGLGCDVIHFPNYRFVACRLPSIYNPHDLLHLHFPEFFEPERLAWRAAVYPIACRLSHTVVVESSWVKADIVSQYGLDAGKVQVIPLAPPTEAYPEPTREVGDRVRRAYALDGPFALYPAVTWPHKNHLRLLDALALLRDRDNLHVRLICTGHKSRFWPRIERRLHELRLQSQVRFLGVVPAQDLRALYRLAQFVVIPTLFEAASELLYEAWHDRAPVACSNVTALPEQAGDAALTFDPYSITSMAAVVKELATNAHTRETLRQRGVRRLGAFSWERTAKAYRAAYRRAAGVPLSEEDRWLLAWDWMRETIATAARA